MSVPTTDCYTKAASVTSRHQPGAMDEKADLHQRLGVTLATGYLQCRRIEKKREEKEARKETDQG